MIRLDRRRTWLLWFSIIVVGISILPTIIHFLGFNFDFSQEELIKRDLKRLDVNEMKHFFLHFYSGMLLHTLLEWSGVMIALTTFVATFVYFKLRGNLIHAVIGVAALCSGTIDAFHILGTDGFIYDVRFNEGFMTSTGLISRIYGAIILIGGVAMIKLGYTNNQTSFNFVFTNAFLLAGVGHLLVHIVSISENLPPLIFENQVVKRPYDLIPLILYMTAGLFFFSKYYKRSLNFTSAGLLLGLISIALTQIHMAFGSSSVYDTHFFIAHFCKIFVWGTLLMGTFLDVLLIDKYSRRRNKIPKVVERMPLKKQKKSESAHKEWGQEAFIVQ